MQLFLTQMGSRWDGSRPLQLSTQSNYYMSIGYGHLPKAKIVSATMLLTELCTGAEEKGGCDYESMVTLAKLGLSRARSDPLYHAVGLWNSDEWGKFLGCVDHRSDRCHPRAPGTCLC